MLKYWKHLAPTLVFLLMFAGNTPTANAAAPTRAHMPIGGDIVNFPRYGEGSSRNWDQPTVLGPDVTGNTWRALTRFDIGQAAGLKIVGAKLTLERFGFAPTERTFEPYPEVWAVDTFVEKPVNGNAGNWTAKVPAGVRKVRSTFGAQVYYEYDVSAALSEARAAGKTQVVFGVKSGNENDGQATRTVQFANLHLVEDVTGIPVSDPSMVWFDKHAYPVLWYLDISADEQSPARIDLYGRDDLEFHIRMEGPAGTFEFVNTDVNDWGHPVAYVNVPPGEYTATGWLTSKIDPSYKSAVTRPMPIHALAKPSAPVVTVTVDGPVVTYTMPKSGHGIMPTMEGLVAGFDYQQGSDGENTWYTVRYPDPGTHTATFTGVNRAGGMGPSTTVQSVTTVKSYAWKSKEYWPLERKLTGAAGTRIPFVVNSNPVWVQASQWSTGLGLQGSTSAVAPSVIAPGHSTGATFEFSIDAASPSTCVMASVEARERALVGYGRRDGRPAAFFVDKGVVTWRDAPAVDAERGITLERYPVSAQVAVPFGAPWARLDGLTPVSGSMSLRLGAANVAGQAIPSCTGSMWHVQVNEGRNF